ncbi:C40 family peptidase [Clostridium tetani]|uniref:NlpC/P60 family protein n=1 Tax=Clostridium tetani TaxID=1513 RepID=A0A4Q0VDT5_CLOTA|nr:C40 family peptidase [Clostridium tetani]RXI50132.1 NlpC/P60 family protein [Clostridium tetani]BDR65054.1 hypothetical protein K134307016_19880 [Clostridium tetani]BDR67860.1 hypothetical protein K144312032_20880 [Clostridium tetani]BDR81795.1 hypothetical protein K234311028_20410 [Clostridium tetani]BDR90177.1 hypothetical protein N072000002_19780 [Clostridium tetani]
MNNKKTKNLLISMVMFFAILFGLNKVNIVKADAPIRTTNSLSKKVVTANVKTNKYIVVPKKDTGSLQSKNGDSLSRGSSRGVDLVSYSYQFMGKPYVWGASGPNSFDCSGFTAYVYKNFGVNLDHYTGSQYEEGKPVSKSELISGDLIFFNTTSSISHVGIYVGGGQFIHASSGGGKVIVSDLSGSYYVSRYAGARRMF